MDGLTPQQRWNRRNPGVVRAAVRRFQENNPERHRAASRRYREEHKPYYAQKQMARQRKVELVTQDTIDLVMAYYGPECVYCGATATGVDHLHPVVHGGTNDFFNLAPCCRPCNSVKRSRPVWVMMEAA